MIGGDGSEKFPKAQGLRASLAMREVLVSSVQATLFVIEAMIQLSWEEQAESLGLVSTGSCLK